MKKKTDNIVKSTIELLKSLEIDGETMEHIIKQLGMEDQMLRQLVMKADMNELKELVSEKEQFEEPEYAIYNIIETKVTTINMWFKGEEYVVKAEDYENGSRAFKVYDCDENELFITFKHKDEFWEIVEGVLKNK